MKKRIGVTASEMLQMREQGLSNYDIARALDISYCTVLKYIGKQDGRMENLKAFKETPVVKRSVDPAEVPELYKPPRAKETFRLSNGMTITLDPDERKMYMVSEERHDFETSYDALPEFMQFLLWMLRERVEK